MTVNSLQLSYIPQLITGEIRNLTFISNLTSSLLITLIPIDEKLPRILSLSINVSLPQGNSTTDIAYAGMSPGRAVYQLSLSHSVHSLSDEYIRISVLHYPFLQWVSAIIGWLYFFCWSVSFYPQIVQNFLRKSAKGLSVDLVLMNLLGYLAYSAFNMSLFWSPYIQREYYSLHPGGIIPVLLNDVIFSLHGFLVTFFVTLQIFFYSKKLSVSPFASFLLILLLLSFVITCILSSLSVTTWLNTIYVLSYIKLIINLFKNIPQIWINYKSKSTDGFSIEGIWLDIFGGALSILQMVILAYNFNDWLSIFGNFVKFWLGVISIGTDIIYCVQHYILYRKAKKGVTCFGVSISSREVEQESKSLLGDHVPKGREKIN